MTVGSAGQRIGSYRLVSELGRGGMGEVWIGEHVEIASRVAIKLIAETADDGARERFLREAKTAASVRHPGIVAVSDFGPIGARGAYLVMELLDGESLAQRVARGPLATPEAIEVGVQIADALVAAHAAGIVHRDLKPANVFLVRDPAARGGARVKLLDFGVAKASRHTDEVGLTATGELVGTPLYMAPEQCASRLGTIDHRTDLYALGVVLFEVVTGAPPFRGPALGDLIDQHVNVPPPSPRAIIPRLPATLDALIVRLLAKAKDDRPRDAAAVSRALAELRDGALAGSGDHELALDTTAAPASGPALALDATAASGGAITVATVAPARAASAPPTRPRPRRRWAVATMVAAVTAAAIAVVVIVVVGSEREQPQRVDRSHASERQLDTDCHDRDGAACGELARRELAKPEPDTARVFAWQTAACDASDLDGCVALADTYQLGHGVRIDLVHAAGLYARGCAGGRARACTAVARARQVGIGEVRDREAAKVAAGTACMLGDAAGCTLAGDLVGWQLDARDTRAAASWFARAEALADDGCQRGDVDACVAHADLAGSSRLGKPDRARTFSDTQRACDLGSTRACGDVGADLISGVAVRPDPPRGFAALRTACMRDDPAACIAVGLSLAYGYGTRVDAEAARKLLDRECNERGDAQCFALANLYSDGRGVPKDPAMALRLWQRACTAGDGMACSMIAGRAPDAEQPELLRRACDLGASSACADLGSWFFRHKDYARALTTFRYACDATAGTSGCGSVGGMLLRGEATARDVAGALGFYERACGHGDVRGCHAFGTRLVEGKDLPPDPRRGLDVLVANCARLWGQSCARAADVLGDGKLVPADPPRAAELRARGCELDGRYCSTDAGVPDAR